MRNGKTQEWEMLSSKDCNDSFTTEACSNFFPRTLCAKHKKKKHDKREPGLFKEENRCSEILCLCSKNYCCDNSLSNNFKFSIKGLKKAKVWRQWRWSNRKISRTVGRNRNKYFYQSYVSHKEPLCSNLQADIDKILSFLSYTNSWAK